MPGQEKDILKKGIRNYFSLQSTLKEEAEKLAEEKVQQEENEKVRSSRTAELFPNE